MSSSLEKFLEKIFGNTFWMDNEFCQIVKLKIRSELNGFVPVHGWIEQKQEKQEPFSASVYQTHFYCIDREGDLFLNNLEDLNNLSNMAEALNVFQAQLKVSENILQKKPKKENGLYVSCSWEIVRLPYSIFSQITRMLGIKISAELLKMNTFKNTVLFSE